MSFGSRELTISVQPDQCPGPTGCNVQTACPGPTFCPGHSACADPSLCLPPSNCPTQSGAEPSALCPPGEETDPTRGAAGLDVLRRQLWAVMGEEPQRGSIA